MLNWVQCLRRISQLFLFSIVPAWRSTHRWEITRVDKLTEYEQEKGGVAFASVQSGRELCPRGHNESTGDGECLHSRGRRLLRHDREPGFRAVSNSTQVLCGGDRGGHRGRSCYWHSHWSNISTDVWTLPLRSSFPFLHQAQWEQLHPLFWQNLYP